MEYTNVRARSIYFIFFLSGASALIYEVVWLRILVRILGSTVYATATVLAAFMAGLALGSYFLGRYADRAPRLLRLYAFLELGIGLSALALPAIFHLLVPLHRWTYDLTSAPMFTLTKALSVFICLTIPTTLMGGTLPVLGRFLARNAPQFGNRIGLLYGVNTLGAVFGLLGTGFLFLGHIGESNTILIGVASNLVAAAAAYYLATREARPQPITTRDEQAEPPTSTPGTRISPYSASTRLFVLIAFAVSGLTALAYEVVWTRTLQLFLETSIYSFTTMLAIYLIGIALGSLWGRRFVDRIKDPILLFALLEIVIAFFGLLGPLLLVPMDKEPFMYLFGAFGRLLAATVLILPITICLGILFPTVSRSVARSDDTVGKSLGQIYSANTVGCILGSLLCGFLFIPLLGTTHTLILLAATNLLIGLFLFLSDLRLLRRPLHLTLVAAGTASVIFLGVVFHDPFYQIIEHRVRQTINDDAVIYLHRENATATITAFGSQTDPLQKHLWLNGVGMTALVTETKLMAHLPILLHEDPNDVLIVCFGMGTTLRSALVHDDVAVDVVELVPDVYDAFQYYHQDGPQILRNPRVRHYADDGRNFLLMRDKRYDVITIDPAPPIHSAGTVNLYSREFIELCKNRLAPEGVLCLWVPPGRYTEVRMIMSTFQSVFPHTWVWRGLTYPGFYLIGTRQPFRGSFDRFRRAFENEAFVADINEWNDVFPSSKALAGLFLLDELELAEYLNGVPIITDNHPYTEFPLWRWLLDPDAQRGCYAKDLLRWREERNAPRR